jgi:hypothetical protein
MYFKVIFISLWSTCLLAETPIGCVDKPKINSEIELLKEITVKTKEQELINFATFNKDKVIQNFIEPTKKTCSSVSYKFPDIKAKPNDSVYFHVPVDLRDRGVRFMILGHRQIPGPGNVAGAYDTNPGLTSVQIHSKDSWSFWGGPSSGKNGAKFAEIGNSAEIENLYDWDHYGHINLSSNETSMDPLLPDAVKITSVGTDEVIWSELTLKVNPPKEVEKQEVIYSEGTKFTPDNHDQKYILSGGQNFQGKFPGAKVISSGNNISIPIKPGMKITSIDIACGDSHSDGQKNSDGGWGKQGWAKLSIGIKKSNGTISWMMNLDNVPPEGVLMTSPVNCDEKTEENSEIVIKSEDDTTYVMGVHIGYSN